MSRALSAAVESALSQQEQTWATCVLIDLVRYAPRVAGVTTGEPTIVQTVSDHGLSTGDAVRLTGLHGITELNDAVYTVTVTGDRSFEIPEDTTTGTGSFVEGPFRESGRVHKLLGFTDHDVDITFGGVTYAAAIGYVSSGHVMSASAAVDNAEVLTVLDAAGISEELVRAGVFDWSELRQYVVDWSAPETTNYLLRRGNLGETTLADGQAQVEFRGMTQKLDQQMIELFSRTCRVHRLGDERCKVDVGPFTVTGTVTSAEDDRLSFTDSSRSESEGYFANGELLWLTGQNASVDNNVVDNQFVTGGSEQSIILREAAPYPIQTGDEYQLVAGCDRRFSTCQSKFSNRSNFRGEPHIIGIDRLITGK